jgi:hypothetical protein
MTTSFARLAITPAKTVRSTFNSTTGKQGTQATSLASIFVIPLVALDGGIRERLPFKTPHMLYETYVQGNPDIVTGDSMVIGSSTYPIRSIRKLPFGNDTRLQLILEDLKSRI